MGAYWSTRNEIDHINQLATGRALRYSPHIDPGPEALLRGYLEGCKVRTEWGFLRQHQIIAYAKNVLARVTRKGNR